MSWLNAAKTMVSVGRWLKTYMDMGMPTYAMLPGRICRLAHLRFHSFSMIALSRLSLLLKAFANFICGIGFQNKISCLETKWKRFKKYEKMSHSNIFNFENVTALHSGLKSLLVGLPLTFLQIIVIFSNYATNSNV